MVRNFEAEAIERAECANCSEPTNGEAAFCDECRSEGWGSNRSADCGILHDSGASL